jgi:hypothetical protein
MMTLIPPRLRKPAIYALAKAEFEAHVGRALASRTHAERAAVTVGIAAPLSAVRPRSTPSPMMEQRTRRKISQAELVP